ncbi:MAG: type II toxin-antitoxin system PemK/MazF family toxin [Actinomycetota bacterium]
MVARQGDIFWAELRESTHPSGSTVRPCLIVQNNLFNRSRINSVIVCAMTTNLNLARAPGNVLLEKGEGGLPKHSVVNVTQVFSILKAELRQKIGSLPGARLAQVLDGIDLVLKPSEVATH